MDIDEMQRRLPSLDSMTADIDAMRESMRRLRNARWAMPAGEQVFPKIPFTASDFNDLVENRCFVAFMTDIRRAVYDHKVGLGFGASILDHALVEGLAMVFGIFDDIEREMFPQEDETHPEQSTPQEE